MRVDIAPPEQFGVIDRDFGNIGAARAEHEDHAEDWGEDPSHDSTILASMGFDPNRKHVPRRSDIWFVAAGLAVALALVLWALFG